MIFRFICTRSGRACMHQGVLLAALKLPVSSMTHREGGSPFKVIDTPYADLINLGLIALVIVISYFVYHRFESIFRDYFRRLALRR